MDRGAWWAAVHGVARSQTQLSDFTFTFHFMHWRRKWQPTPVFLPGESQGRGSLVGCCLMGCTESDTTEVTQQQQQQDDIQQNDSLIHTYIIFHIFHYDLFYSIEYSSLCYTVRPYFIQSNLYLLIPNCPFHYRGLEGKSRKSRNTWNNRQIWPWSTE